MGRFLSPAHPTKTASGALFLRPEEPLFFANTEQVLQAVSQRVRTRQARVVVLSLEVTDDLDTTAAEALLEFCHEMASSGVQLLLARVKDRPRQALAAASAGGRIKVPACYWSVADAADAAHALMASES